MKTCIVIPARMASTRLPSKPLADICGVPMVLRVAMAARKAGLGEPLIAAADTEIHKCASQAGYHCVLTPASLPSGTDRVQAALQLAGIADNIDCVVNLQGDMPNIDPKSIQQAAMVLQQTPSADIATLVALSPTEQHSQNPDVVKAVLTPIASATPELENRLFRALYFSRCMVPAGQGPHYQHIGIYAYRRAALRKFTQLPQTPLEQREKLEQLRALENGMQIVAALVDEVPLAVDSPADLQNARNWFQDKT